MPAADEDFAYAILRVVPDLARGEALNAGVVLFCRRRGFLGAAIALDRDRLRALDADARRRRGAAPPRGPRGRRRRGRRGRPAGPPPAVRALRLAHRAVEHRGPAVAGAHGPLPRRPAGGARPALRAARAALAADPASADPDGRPGVPARQDAVRPGLRGGDRVAPAARRGARRRRGPTARPRGAGGAPTLPRRPGCTAPCTTAAPRRASEAALAPPGDAPPEGTEPGSTATPPLPPVPPVAGVGLGGLRRRPADARAHRRGSRPRCRPGRRRAAAWAR